ncbi:UNVERIFIED_CONTAM: CoA-binding protein, partial [Salmonella enterica subsp. enterica serovar Weltevreden]
MDWNKQLVQDSEGIAKLLADCRTIAVLGLKTEAQAEQP